MCKGPEDQKPEVGKKIELASDEQWLKEFSYEAFEKDMKDLRKTLVESQGEDDVKHLNKIILWNRTLAALGLGTMWMTPNPFTIFCLSFAIFSSWTMLGHHVCHGGYDKTSASDKGYNRFKFAVGSVYRRVSDWLDWMLPEAWNVEHNLMHHYHLNELTDPDLVQRNTRWLRDLQKPMFVKYLVVALNIVAWKWFYYAPNTFSQLEFARYRKEQGTVDPAIEKEFLEKTYILTSLRFYKPWLNRFKLLTQVHLPYLVFHFILPAYACKFFVGDWAFSNALTNLILADMLTNAHSFLMIVTNHAGNDMYYFETPCRPRSGAFFLRQVLGSVNFSTGTDTIDFAHGWLNYQIEHHLFPDLSMLSYQKAQPLVKAICEKHNVPYIQENVFTRLKKTIDIMVGKTSMRKFPE